MPYFIVTLYTSIEVTMSVKSCYEIHGCYKINYFKHAYMLSPLMEHIILPWLHAGPKYPGKQIQMLFLVQIPFSLQLFRFLHDPI